MLVKCAKTRAVAVTLLLLLNAAEFPCNIAAASSSSHSSAGHSSSGSRPSGGAHSYPVRPRGSHAGGVKQQTGHPGNTHGSQKGTSSARPPVPHPPPYIPPVIHPQPTRAEIANQSRNSGRAKGVTALEAERRARDSFLPDERAKLHAAALEQYLGSVDSLEESRKNLTGAPAASINIPLAKSHLDAARELALQHRPAVEVQWHVEEARRRLYDVYTPDLPNHWMWRLHFLLGDVCIFENDPNGALTYYRQTVAETTDFVPAQAMVQYLTNAEDNSNTNLPVSDTGSGVDAIQDSPIPASSSNPQAQTTSPNPSLNPSQENVKAMTGQLKQNVPAQKLYQSAPAPQTTSKPSQIDLQKIGSFLGLVATVLEITELAEVAAAIQIGSMIGEYLAQPKK